MPSKVMSEVGFWIVAVAPVLSVIALPVVVLQDGGLHLSAATALGELLADGFSDVIVWRPGIPPNITVEFALLGLLQVLPPVWALKLLVAAILMGFAFAARLLVTAAGVPGPWAMLLLPFAWNRPLAWGFLGFSAGVVLAMFAIALALRRPDRPRVLVLAVLLALTWFTHLIPALVGTAVCAAVIIAALVERRHKDNAVKSSRALRGIALVSLPVLLLTVTFLVLNPSGTSQQQSATLVQRLIGVVGMTRADVSTVQTEFLSYRLVALLLYTAAAVSVILRLRRGWQVRSVDAMLLSAILGAVAAVVVPEGVDGAGGFLGVRLSLFPPPLLAVWVAAHLGRVPEGTGHRKIVAAVAAVLGVISLLLVTMRLPAQSTFSGLVVEILELTACLPERSTVLQLPLDDGRSLAVEMSPLSEQVGFIASERHALDMGNEAGWVPYYLWQYRPDRRPDRILGTQSGGLFSVPPRMNLGEALSRSVRLDAIVVVGRRTAQKAVLEDGPTQRTLRDLTANYQQVRISSQGTAELWLRNGIGKSCH